MIKIKKLKKFKRQLVKSSQMEAKEAILASGAFIHQQLSIRPRIRLFSKVVLILALATALFAPASKYLNEQKTIKINGQKIVIGAPNQPQLEATSENGIDQTVEAAKSPFIFQKPVDGYISQPFTSYHNGDDIAAPLGSPIHAVGEGTVEFAGFLAEGHGNTVVIDHGNGLKSLYAHMSRIYVGVGNKIDPQYPIGAIGMTGHTTGPHVHLEITDNGIHIDPQSVLPQ